MKVVLLCGGLGTRISEESHLKPKPMIEIGGRPILWHIMKLFSHYGFNEFVLCLGYKGYVIKEYFANYVLHNADLTIDLAKGATEYHATNNEPWKVTLVDTGAETMTGGRLKRVADYLPANEPFFLTYGDGVADVDLAALLAFTRPMARTPRSPRFRRRGVTARWKSRMAWCSGSSRSRPATTA
jgi:glucose-1-phosphate cytidylyltransferase